MSDHPQQDPDTGPSKLKGVLKMPVVRMKTMVEKTQQRNNKDAYISVSDLKSSLDDDVGVHYKPIQAPIFDNKHTPQKNLHFIKLSAVDNAVGDGLQTSPLKGPDETPMFTGTKPFYKTKPSPDDPNAWRAEQDPLKMYQLDKYFKVGDILDSQKQELTRYKQSDVKGLRKTQYMKEIGRNTDLILIPVEQSRLEKLQSYEDRWPLLNFRKAILKTAIYINMVATKIATHKAFEWISIMVILLNCIQLASDNSSEEDEKKQYMVIIDYMFTAAYTLEMIIKILSRGFVFNQGAYLRDAFNILDFVIVMSSLLTIFQSNTNTQLQRGKRKQKGVSLNSLRVFRVLRPLRSITAIRGLKILVQSLISALPLLKDTIVVLIFFLLIFAIAGIQLISGNLKHRCINIKTGRMFVDEEHGLSDKGVLCGAHLCPEIDHYCGKMNANPDYGVTNYDNIFWAFMMTFQNITLEGWSDTQKYYEMTSGLFVIIFFTLNVFIGAFFLLNLTLAVINSSFTRMNEKYQKQFQEEKEKKRKALQSLNKKDDEEEEFHEQEDDEDKQQQPLGLTEYFVAKRATKKMIDYFKRKAEERKHIEAKLLEEAERKEEDQNEQLMLLSRANTIGPPPPTITVKKMSSPDQSPKRSVLQPNEEGSNLRKQKYHEFQLKMEQQAQEQKSPSTSSPLRSGRNKVAHHTEEPDKRKKQIQIDLADPNMTITEEEDSSLSVHSDIVQQVDKFLQDIDSNKNDNSQAKEKKGQHLGAEISATKLIGFIDNGGVLKGNQSASNRVLHMADNRSRLSDKVDSIAFLDELALDKIIAEEHLQPQNVQVTKKPSDENKNSGDAISLQMSWDYPQYLSDNDIVKPKHAFDDDASSVISSDSSFNNELMMLEAQANEQKEKRANKNNQQERDIFREARKRYHRQRTLQQSKKKTLNDTSKSTFYLDSTKNNDQPMDKKIARPSVILVDGKIAIPSPMSKNDVDSPRKKQGQQKDARKIISENYQLIDDKFLNWKKPKDPYDFIDRKRQKIDINPGAKYISSSQNEILETRQFNMWKKSMASDLNPQARRAAVQNIRRANKFLKPDGVMQEEETYQDEYIEPMFEAYQLKTRYQIKQVEQVEFDSDDDDNLILAIQPYDTVMNVGYSHMLSHLPTKFVTRRSDIIVSSTMSITLTPQDDEYVPQNTNSMNEDQICEWVNLRHQFRAQNIRQAKITDITQEIMAPTASELQSSRSGQPESENYSNDGSEMSKQISRSATSKSRQAVSKDPQIREKKRKLPADGLSQPLTPLEVQQLDQDQKLIYSKWKGKFDASIRMLKKQKQDPANVHKNYTLEDAQKMLEGTFYEQEDDADQPNNGQEKGTMGLDIFNKQMFINRQHLKDELDLQAFEKVLRKIADDEVEEQEQKANQIFDIVNKKDEISDEIRQEFELPDDVKGNAVDYNEVRRSDVAKKRRTPTWSGQDVLCISYNRDHAEYVTDQMSSLRVWPKGFPGVVKRIRYVIKKFINSGFMDNVMTLAVFINTVVMALDRYGIKENEKAITNTINQFFTYMFIAEFGLKMIGVGPQKYVENRMNLLDGGVVMLSLLELFMGSGTGALSAFRSVRVFRTFRVLRVARILRSLKQMQQIISILSKSASSFAYIAVLLMIFLFIFALIGMQTFGRKLNFEDGVPRGNYDNFTVAFLTAFQTLTMENWNALFYDAIRSNVMKFISGMYYISWIFIGNFILLNLFLAILLDSFLQEEEEEQTSEEALAAEQAALEMKKKMVKKEKERRLKKLGQQLVASNLEQNQNQPKKEKKGGMSKLAKTLMGQNQAQELIDDIDDLDSKQLVDYLVELKFYQLEKKDIKDITFADAEIHCDKALYLFSQENWFRKKLLKFSKSKFFDNFIMALIVLSSLKLALDSYFTAQQRAKAGLYYSISYYLDLFFTIMFAIEMVTKILTMGFIMDDGSYLRESWNQLDFFIVVTSLFDLMMTGKSLGFIKVIRLLRILRPLRFISHNQGMKMIVAALLDSGGAMLNVLIVIMIVWLMFAILGIQLFMGKFFYCSKDTYLIHSKTDCLKEGYQWKRFNANFDNVKEAMKALFIIATFEGWPDIMHQAVDATGIDEGPLFENNIYFGYYFVLFILVGSFFLVNFLIGVLFLKYTQAQKEEAKNFTQEQLNWIDIQRMIEKARVDHAFRYQPRESIARMKVWKIVQSDWFGLVVMGAILLNMVQMACSYDGMPDYWKRLLKYSNYIFSGIFLIECVLKLFVYRQSYFYTTWNKFDFFVVCASIVDVLLDFVSGPKFKALSVVPQLSRVLRVLRVSRVLRLAGKNEGLQALLMTIQMSVTSLLNVTALLMLILFMFAVLGGFLFQNVSASDKVYQLLQMDPEFKNFSNFHNSLILIFVLSTGENWPLVMYDVSQTKNKCGPTTCGSSYATLFFFTFVMIVQKIMLNLFILVIIQQFEQYYVSEDNPIQKFKNNLVLFEKVWIEFTEKHHHVKIKEKLLPQFFKKLPLPIGIPEDTPEPEFKKQMLKMGIRGEEGYIYFNELLYRCMRRQYGRFKLNKQMTIFEIQIQFRLLQQRQQEQETSQKVDQKILVKKLTEQQFAFNPFMLLMFQKISFNKWLNMARNELLKKEYDLKMEIARKEAEEQGIDFHPSEMVSQIQIDTEKKKTYLDIEEIVYITSEEEDSDDSDEESFAKQSKSARVDEQSHNSSFDKRQLSRSPDNQIKRFRHLKSSVTKRFREFGGRQGSGYIQSPDQMQSSPDPNDAVFLKSNKKNQLIRLGLDEKANKRKTLVNPSPPAKMSINLIDLREQPDISLGD